MTKEEFIRIAVSGGYCTRKTAEKYAEGRTLFDEQDFIAVYRYTTTRVVHLNSPVNQHLAIATR